MTGLTGKLVPHPAEFSPEVIDAVRPILRGYLDTFRMVVDPFAGRGHRLAALCAELERGFFGLDIEEYANRHPRVFTGNSLSLGSMPVRTDYCVVTSPPYTNRISTDYVNGPTPNTKLNGRRSYGTSLGHALHQDNIARDAKPGNPVFYAKLGQAMKLWQGQLALLNVDEPMSHLARQQLTSAGFEVVDEIEVVTRRYGGVVGAEKRAPHEVVLVGVR